MEASAVRCSVPYPATAVTALGSKYFGNELEQNIGCCRERLAQGEDARIACGQRRQCRPDQQKQRSVKTADNQRHAIRLAIDHTFVAGLSQESRHWRLHRLHPLLELALWTSVFARRWRRTSKPRNADILSLSIAGETEPKEPTSRMDEAGGGASAAIPG